VEIFFAWVLRRDRANREKAGVPDKGLPALNSVRATGACCSINDWKSQNSIESPSLALD
jgi:hypothetical protein